jgi:lipopolysaccharide/colanic/teichoic acid biosynthesis glycosyltransferase/vacuolar-type H+-ATPase subunit H
MEEYACIEEYHKKTPDEEKIERILETVEKIRDLAESEADEIIEGARKKADEILLAAEKRANENRQTEDHSTNGVSSKRVFRIILERERARSDRNGQELSLILFDLCFDNNHRAADLLVSVLKTRARSVDRFGWYEKGKLGIVLPNTTYNGAVTMGRDICSIMVEHKVQPPVYKVYTYPSKWMVNGKQCTGNEALVKHLEHRYVEGVDPIFVSELPRWKRAVDIFGALTALTLFSPFFLFVPLLIKTVSRGPVFFTQERVGYGGRIFRFIKFRTMKVNADRSEHQNYYSELIHSNTPMTKLDRSDPRIIPFGRLLRKACIDELPQLICVLKGDMSLVGPRPCLPTEAREYLKWHRYRFDIKPGMTGLWQVSGKDRLTFKEMIRLDILYAKKLSFRQDVRIILKTIPTVFSIIRDKIRKDTFIHRAENRKLAREQFKEYIRRYYNDIYNVDRLEFLDDKLGSDGDVDLLQIMMLLSRIDRLSPSYNVAKRYFGICRLIDFERKSGPVVEKISV